MENHKKLPVPVVRVWMRKFGYTIVAVGAAILSFTSCNTLDKASMHGFNSGYYMLESDKEVKKVYTDVAEDKIDIYNLSENRPDNGNYWSIPLTAPDSLPVAPLIFRKQSLDIDITTILIKYRPSVHGLPPQLTTDLNLAIYAGWRHDNYKMSCYSDPLGRRSQKITGLGYDIGVFAGPGTTQISPFTTRNQSENEYSGMIFQLGIATFLESNVASFGVAAGFDYLLNRDRDIWIYTNKPWVGFVVGIALN